MTQKTIPTMKKVTLLEGLPKLRIIQGNYEPPPPPDPPTPGLTLPLHISGLHFVKDNGDIYKGLHVSAFRDFELFLKGDFNKLDNWNSKLKRFNYTGKRVFAHHNPGHDKFDPRDYNNYYGRMREYFQYCTDQGFYVHFTCLLGAVEGYDPFLTYDEQYKHLENCRNAADGFGNVLLEIANEGDDNGMPATINRFPKNMFSGTLTARTRIINTDEETKNAQIDWQTLHPERKDPYNIVRKYRDLNLITSTGGFYRPIIAGEPGQADRDMRPDQYRTATALCMMFGEIQTVHGSWETLQQCNFPDSGPTYDCLREASEIYNLNIVPPNASDWAYSRDEAAPCEFILRGDENGPSNGCQHLYCMTDNNRAVVVPVERGKDFKYVPKSGWHIVREDFAAAYLERN